MGAKHVHSPSWLPMLGTFPRPGLIEYCSPHLHITSVALAVPRTMPLLRPSQPINKQGPRVGHQRDHSPIRTPNLHNRRTLTKYTRPVRWGI